jgi:hypothetical protein
LITKLNHTLKIIGYLLRPSHCDFTPSSADDGDRLHERVVRLSDDSTISILPNLIEALQFPALLSVMMPRQKKARA